MLNLQLQKRASWSSRAQRGICFLFFVVLFLPLVGDAQAPPRRPRILGIEGVTIHVSDPYGSRKFYFAALNQHENKSKPCFWCEKPPSFSLDISLNKFQSILLKPLPGPPPSNLIKEITFWTDNVATLRSYLLANLSDSSSLTGPGMKYLSLTDPESHRISFVETDGVLKDSKVTATQTKGGYENEIIHAGFVVHDRPAMEHFYKDILGFHPYWHGGMKDDGEDWVSFQVPDGSESIEFMLNIPENADQRLRGIMNHIALGVTDIHAAQEQLRKNGAPLSEEPKIGRDGKWQLNLYDPDQTR